MYEYRGKILKVVDGDTMDFEVDLGFKIKIILRLRILGLDTAELHSQNEEEKIHAKAALAKAIELLLNKDVTIKTERVTEKYGRYLAFITLPDGRSYTDVMRDLGFSKKAVYAETPEILA
jgi:micrococcal nuclease